MSALTLKKEEICEKVKQNPVLFDKQFKGYREKGLVTNAWNAVTKEIEIGRFLLSLRKNNWEEWIESEVHLEPKRLR